MRKHKKFQHSQNQLIWPGFVDALSTLLLVVIFLLMIFFLGQFFLQVTITGQNEVIDETNKELYEAQIKLQSFQEKIAYLEDLIEKQQANLVIQEASSKRQKQQIQNQLAKIDQLENRKEELELKINQVKSERDQFEFDVKKFSSESVKKSSLIQDLQAEKTKIENELNQLRIENKKLQQQVKILAQNLEFEKESVQENQKIIDDLTHQLNIALSDKVAKLAKYRSEFFGRLREILGDNYQTIQISGDRFIFSSEVLFPSGSAELQLEGKKQLKKVSDILKNISSKIPEDIQWILRVDGHTDTVPISSSKYPSNWELSQARALSVVRFLIENGIPAHKLAAAGFSEFHPIDGQNLKLNRRIELKLTEK